MPSFKEITMQRTDTMIGKFQCFINVREIMMKNDANSLTLESTILLLHSLILPFYPFPQQVDIPAYYQRNEKSNRNDNAI